MYGIPKAGRLANDLLRARLKKHGYIVMETTTITADLTTCKLHMNGAVSTPGAIFAGGDVKDFYLITPLKRNRYGKVRAK